MGLLQFHDQGSSESGKTKIWSVTSALGGHSLGSISFFPQWRKYVFQPSSGSVIFDYLCLHELADFAQKATAEWRKNL